MRISITDEQIFSVLLIANLVAMIVYSAKIWSNIRQMKYRFIYTLRALTVGNYEPMGWACERKFHYVDYFLGWVVPTMCVIQASQLDIGLPHIRTVVNLFFAVFFWGALALKDHLKNNFIMKTEIKLIQAENALKNKI